MGGTDSVEGAGGGGVGQAAKDRAKRVANPPATPPSTTDGDE